jgi:hypothetical protein
VTCQYHLVHKINKKYFIYKTLNERFLYFVDEGFLYFVDEGFLYFEDMNAIDKSHFLFPIKQNN